jgi:hypothetical protein
VGIDLVAMCQRDLIVQDAEPLFPRLFLGKLELNITTAVVFGRTDGCRIAGCALIGRRPPKCRACMRRAIMTWPALPWAVGGEQLTRRRCGGGRCALFGIARHRKAHSTAIR